jgi:signal transduction histidine kinase/Pyruvate/2-oxoacid:ferredoxin oxidoreductase delta subunit
MMRVGNSALVTTEKDRCRMCYTCVRECPAKAIRVSGFQASVESVRCIGCGNCVRVCSQGAKSVQSALEDVLQLLEGEQPVVAIIAPSFPAEFSDMEPNRLVGMLKKVGFADVFEVSFGADLVAQEYVRVLQITKESYIGSTCPSVVSYIEKFHPDLVPHLMPIVSPMIATARVVRKKIGENSKVVFIGPCVAKKGEAKHHEVQDEVNAVLTFAELRDLFSLTKTTVDNSALSTFATPRGRLGGIFAVTRGLFEAAGLREDILEGSILAAEGNPRFISAIKEFRKGGDSVRLLELLCCNGCIMGVGFSRDEHLLVRRSHVSDYVRHRVRTVAREEHATEAAEFNNINLARTFSIQDCSLAEPTEEELLLALRSMGKENKEDELNCGACGYQTCREHAVAVFRSLAEPEMCLPYMVVHLRDTVAQLETSNQDLLRMQEALTQTEKLASMGQMAAGIAHEVNNPLGIVLLYANLMLEECVAGTRTREDLEIVVEQANRCKKIVTGLLNFARQNKVFRQKTNMIEFIEKATQTLNAPENILVIFENRVGPHGPIAHIDADQMLQVMLNLMQNAIAAMPSGGNLTLVVRGDSNTITLEVRDTGTGISEENIGKIFDPFFSTKPVGKGTGLGLAVVHGIIKMHQGKITVESNSRPETGPCGSKFIVNIPRDEI